MIDDKNENYDLNLQRDGPSKTARLLGSRITPFFKAFIIIQEWANSEHAEQCKTSLGVIKEILKYLYGLEENTSKTVRNGRILQLITPIILSELKHKDPKKRKLAIASVSEIAQHQGDPTIFLEVIALRLKDKENWVARAAAAKLEIIAREGWDLTLVESILENTIKHQPDWSIRSYVSYALSRHLQNSGREPSLKIHEGIKSFLCWSVKVSHRKMFSANDEIKKIHQNDQVAWHVCGVCGNKTPDLKGTG